MRPLVIGTRGSRLALAQARWAMERLRSACPGLDVRAEIIRTRGDRVRDRPLAAIGEKGLFVKEIEHALRAGEIDAAVHSLKDLPSALAPEFTLAAVPERASPADCLVAPAYGSLSALPEGAIVGTGSPRRKAQLLAMRPDLDVRDIRGNVDTRLEKVGAGQYQAAVLAAAGLERLGLRGVISQIFAPAEITPAVGQGALGIEARSDDEWAVGLLRRVNDPAAEAAATAERGFAEALGASCTTPVGALAVVTGKPELLHLTVALCDAAGTSVIRRELGGEAERPRELGFEAAALIREAGGDELLRPCR